MKITRLRTKPEMVSLGVLDPGTVVQGVTTGAPALIVDLQEADGGICVVILATGSCLSWPPDSKVVVLETELVIS